ncbi:DUF6339 family protein [Corynebacterium coyleae]|uniref:DUF6339 family protein n=1 Tax=Corynebacterium coyleae TaxID=53374 RepID=UPI00254B82FF|nr:DUF6339 family protein [Corynebacterium coyleae]MDK8663204.1 DUF6339 family protein [Corynebacterium coyleae]MDK8706450.1 DUF6339 family protein [Corynebacterium coyleae]MDK8733159.1 DUF6339 family protein [Corynebacterium coyleae]MDK8892492.1 DUF6339 family protein [Corynebacterium coyleae]
MSELLVWPRMQLATAEKKFSLLSLKAGPEVDTSLSMYDFSAIGNRVDEKLINAVRDEIVDIASAYGFRRRRGFDQDEFPTVDIGRSIDREFTRVFRQLTPMRWAEAGSREVWSWFSLALLPDVTHWRWKPAVIQKKGERRGEWYRERWIGGDMTRHTWSRYWWRSLQLDGNVDLLNFLNEHEYNHFTERANSIGANPLLMVVLAETLMKLQLDSGISHYFSRRQIFDECSKRILRKMAYIDVAVLDRDEMEALIERFVLETRRSIGHSDGSQ